MSKKHFEAAARIVQDIASEHADVDINTCDAIKVCTNAFVALFRDDNPRFDEARFRLACVPGNNVRARPRKVTA